MLYYQTRLVAEWRELRTRDEKAGNRVDRARARVRRWELEVVMIRDFGLTLPPETEPLDEAGRADHLRWWLDALAEARWELAESDRVRLLRRKLTLGLSSNMHQGLARSLSGRHASPLAYTSCVGAPVTCLCTARTRA